MTPPALTAPEQLALLQAAFHTTEGGIMVIDREFNIILANKWIENQALSHRAGGRVEVL